MALAAAVLMAFTAAFLTVLANWFATNSLGASSYDVALRFTKL
jgi:hypothetical protein